MPIYEYHNFEDEDYGIRKLNRGCLFEGHWIVKQKYDEYPVQQLDGSHGYYYLEWMDIFGYQDNRRIDLPSGEGEIKLLSEDFALLIRQHSLEKPQLFRGLRLEWKNETIVKGERVLERSDHWDEAVIVDSAGPLPNGNICFLLVKDGEPGHGKPFEYAHHCRLDARDLKIVRDSRPIPLDSDEFNCIDLNGDIISGLSTSLLEIKRYNFRTRKLVDTILVHGLPPTISCLWHKNQNRVNLASRGVWTPDYLLLWSKEGGEYPGNEYEIDEDVEYDATKESSVYHVGLLTGLASATSLNFNGWIKEFAIGPGGYHLYIRVDEYLRRSNRSNKRFCGYYPPIYKFRYLRVPFNTPESLFFLASVALPRPLSPIALEIIKQNSKTAPIPLNICK